MVVAVGERVAGVVRRVDVDQVDRLAPGEEPEHVEVVALDEGVPHAHAPTVGRATRDLWRQRPLVRACPSDTRCSLTLLALASLTATTPAVRVRGRERTDGHQRLPDQRPRSGHDRAGADLLHALQAGRRQRHEAGADDPAQPRLGRLADHGPGSVPAVARREVRRPVLRPARVRRERWQRPGREPGCRGPRRPRTRRPGRVDSTGCRKDAPGDPRLGAIGGSYGGGYQFLGAFEELRLHGKPVFDALAPEITWNDLNQQPRARGRRAHRVGPRTRGRRPADPGAATSGLPGARPGSGHGLVARRLGARRHRTWRSSSRRTARASTSRRAAGSTSRCCSGRAPPTRCSTSSRAWTTGAPRSRARPAGTASSSATTAATCCPAVYPHGRRRRPPTRAASSSPAATSPTLALHFMNENLKHRDTGLQRLRQATTWPRPTSTCTTVKRGHRRHRRSPSARSPPPRPAAPPLAYPVAKGPIRIAGSRRTSPGPSPRSALNNRAFYGLGVGTTSARRRTSCRTT